MKTNDILCKLAGHCKRELSSAAFGCSQLLDGLHSDAKGTLPMLVLCCMSCIHTAQLCGKSVQCAFTIVDNLIAHVKTAHQQPSRAGCDKMGHMVEGRGLLCQ